MNQTLSRWHQFIEKPKAEILQEILAEDVQFHSPFIWKPKDGKAITTQILLTVSKVFQNFRYVREITQENQFCLEFEANIGELTLRGVDLIQMNDDGKINDFEVMIRPANALQMLGMEMGKRLQIQ
ncbi:nuclear transport factor 2 family protein [soil metagenome]